MNISEEKSAWENEQSENIKCLRNATGLWLLSFAIAALGPKYLWDFNTPLTIAFVIASVLFGIKMILTNKKYLQGLDELQRKIQTDAMSVSLGVGLIFGCTYKILENIKLISFQPEISHLIVVIALVYLVAIVSGVKKYQ